VDSHATPTQLGLFLDSVVDDALFAFWWLSALRGLRRGEVCGLRWTELDLDRGVLFVERNRTTAGYAIVEGDPKTSAGRRPVALDPDTVRVLRQHRQRQRDQQAHREATGKSWVDSGYVFVRKDGHPIHPGYASGRFRLLIRRSGLPPVRLHDLRHGAASLAHAAGADLKILQDLLGHSSILVTADTYTSVLPLTQRRTADATADLVLAAAHRTRTTLRRKGLRTRSTPRPAAGAPTLTPPSTHEKVRITTSQPITERDETRATPTRHPSSTTDGHSGEPARHRRSSDSQSDGAPGEIRTPNLLIRSPNRTVHRVL
jgi:hypothetical protein